MKPSDFKIMPMLSRAFKSEAETVAQNIMVILARTGNAWRRLSWDEYEAERHADLATSRQTAFENKWFDAVVEYTISEDAARRFSPVWARVGQNEIQS